MAAKNSILASALTSFSPPSWPSLLLALGTPCSASRCATGQCDEAQGTRACLCPPNKKGWDCSENAELCVSDCGVDTAATGTTCQQVLCGQGTCTSSGVPPFYVCDCGAFHTGSNCEIETNPCSSPSTDVCAPNGVCRFVLAPPFVSCTCLTGWEHSGQLVYDKRQYNGVQVTYGPQCDAKKTKGLTSIPINISSSQQVIWWIVLGVCLVLFFFCFCTLCAETCSKNLKALQLLKNR
eukprot:GHVT01101688.1.p1 GENE.GHVT01101688.1~~GHVT01101688.1.p1  ORF type:complete len:237 (-),score=50.73 GHVT01101688.1:1463-2173(-)